MSEATERVTVSTYVPEYQRDEWREHASELGMSQSEFVRTMVQAGRRGFTLNGASTPVEPDDPAPNPGGEGLQTRLLELLDEETLDWEELVDAVTDDVEAQVEGALEALQDQNLVRYRPREGGYAVVDDE